MPKSADRRKLPAVALPGLAPASILRGARAEAAARSEDRAAAPFPLRPRRAGVPYRITCILSRKSRHTSSKGELFPVYPSCLNTLRGREYVLSPTVKVTV